MGFFSRRDRKYSVPPPPSKEIEEKVAEVATTAEIQLERAENRNEEVEVRTERLDRIRQKNALGQRFWQAAGLHRRG